MVKNLLNIDNLEGHQLLEKINPDNISLKEGVLLIEIMRNKASELNNKFNTTEWTPRKIDKILWCIDR